MSGANADGRSRVLDQNLALRVASALVGLPVLGAVVLWRNTWGLFGLTLLVVIGALTEYTALAMAGAPGRERAATIVLGALVHTAVFARPEATLPAVMLTLIVLGAFALGGASAPDHKGALQRFGVAAAGIAYIPLLLVSLPLLHRDFPFGRWWVVIAVAVTFAADTGAYFVGRALGRAKLAPTISPGKTIEGAIGGLAAAVGFMFVARATFLPSLTPMDIAVVGVAAGVLGPVGDLFESLLKRAAGAKDSGRLIPGHGGLLDRLDAVLFVGGAVYVYVAWVR